MEGESYFFNGFCSTGFVFLILGVGCLLSFLVCGEGGIGFNRTFTFVGSIGFLFNELDLTANVSSIIEGVSFDNED